MTPCPWVFVPFDPDAATDSRLLFIPASDVPRAIVSVPLSITRLPSGPVARKRSTTSGDRRILIGHLWIFRSRSPRLTMFCRPPSDQPGSNMASLHSGASSGSVQGVFGEEVVSGFLSCHWHGLIEMIRRLFAARVQTRTTNRSSIGPSVRCTDPRRNRNILSRYL